MFVTIKDIEHLGVINWESLDELTEEQLIALCGVALIGAMAIIQNEPGLLAALQRLCVP